VLLRYRCFFVALILLALLLIVACTPSKPSPAVSPTPTAKQQYGGVLKIYYNSSPTNVGNPGVVSGGGPEEFCGAPAFESLVRLDETGRVIPMLATDWQISPDLKSITFNLRKGVKFHDGTDFDASAAKYCLDLYKGTGDAEFESISSTDVVNDNTIRINLSQFQAQILTNLAGKSSRMISPTAIKTNDKDWLMTHIVGTGPFKQVSFQRDVSIKYEKFNDYWQKGKPYLDGIEISFVADPVTALLSFKAGEAQVNKTTIPPKDAAGLLQEGSKYNITQSIGSVYFLMGDGSNADSPFKDIRVRQAVGYAVDNEKIALLGNGFWEITNQPFATKNWGYNPTAVGYPYNPQKAKQLLAEAGYPNGFKTSIFASTKQDYLIAIQSYLKEAGINAELQVASTAASFTTIRTTGGWHNGLLAFATASSVDIDPGQSLVRFMSNSPFYVSMFRSSDFDAALSKANAEPDFNKRKASIQAASKLMIDNYAMLTCSYSTNNVTAKYSGVHDDSIGYPCSNRWTPENAWLSK
jgi:peptide/nickel transport system substrate-binding protein